MNCLVVILLLNNFYISFNQTGMTSNFKVNDMNVSHDITEFAKRKKRRKKKLANGKA